MRTSLQDATWGLTILNMEMATDIIKYTPAMALAITKYLHTF